MKRTLTLFLLAALSLSACDKAKEVSAEASVKAGKAMEKAAEVGAGAAEKSKEAATGMMEKTKELAGDALAKTKELGGDAVDFTKEKLVSRKRTASYPVSAASSPKPRRPSCWEYQGESGRTEDKMGRAPGEG